MSSEKLHAALDSNFWDLKQPIESQQKKRAKQILRRNILKTASLEQLMPLESEKDELRVETDADGAAEDMYDGDGEEDDEEELIKAHEDATSHRYQERDQDGGR